MTLGWAAALRENFSLSRSVPLPDGRSSMVLGGSGCVLLLQKLQYETAFCSMNPGRVCFSADRSRWLRLKMPNASFAAQNRGISVFHLSGLRKRAFDINRPSRCSRGPSGSGLDATAGHPDAVGCHGRHSSKWMHRHRFPVIHVVVSFDASDGVSASSCSGNRPC